MKTFYKLPFYAGLFVFVISVLFSAIKIGEKNFFVSQRAKAQVEGAILEMKFLPPNSVNVFLVSQKPVAGLDVVVKFEKDKVQILPSTLQGSSSFITSGGVVEEGNSSFSFSALPKGEGSAGLVASFAIRSVSDNFSPTKLVFLTGERGSAVLEKVTLKNILTETKGVEINNLPK